MDFEQFMLQLASGEDGEADYVVRVRNIQGDELGIERLIGE